LPVSPTPIIFPNRSSFKPSLHGLSCLLTLITVYFYVFDLLTPVACPGRQVPVLPSTSSLLRFAFRLLLLCRSDMRILVTVACVLPVFGIGLMRKYL